MRRDLHPAPMVNPTQAGDIAFYVSHGSVIDQAIVLRTGSKYVHVAIFESQGSTVAATSGGITRQHPGNEYAIWRPPTGYDQDRLTAALAWLDGEVGKAYGYADIVNQVLLLSDRNPILLDKSEDCSVLATKFLWIAGAQLPAALIEVHRVTPGGLAVALLGDAR